MRIVRTLGLLALAGAVPLAAQTGEMPCAAVKTTGFVPCDAPKDAVVLATADGGNMTEADLDEALRARRARLEQDVEDARRDALRDEIEDTLLRLEAGRRGVPLRDLYESEVLRKTPPPADDELKALYAKWSPRRPGTFDELRPVLRSQILADHRASRTAELAASLRERFPVTPGADPGAPGPASDVLATVGPEAITRASAASRLDAAAFRVRYNLFRDQRAALEKAAESKAPKKPASAGGATKGAADEPALHLVGLQPPPAPLAAPDLTGAPSRGPESARVTVVEYADFECPPCGKAWPMVDEALKPYGDRVRYVFRNYTMPFHPYAVGAAAAGRAAHAQGRFFPYADMLFRSQAALDDASLRTYAGRLGLDLGRFDADRARMVADVLVEKRLGAREGVRGTPALFVNGVWIESAQMNVAGIRAAVDAALANRVLAKVDGAPLGTADLDALLQKRIATVDAAVADARRAALEAEVADVRLHLEAERLGLSFRDFWEAEVLRKTPAVTDAEVNAGFERTKKWFPGRTVADLRPRLESISLAGKRGKREAEVAASLKERFPLVPGADPNAPGLAPDTVLATVGGRKVTASFAATRLDAAGYSVRRDLYYDELNAVQDLAQARLLKAEADRRGVTVESLEKDKVDVGQGHTVTFVAALPEAPALTLDVAGSRARGPADAAVTVVEYADFECPHCSKGWTAAEEALKPYGDRVRYAFRNFPLPFHEHALKAAEAGWAAAAQGRFFELAGLMFRNQEALDTPSLKKYAADAGCDPVRFAADLDSGRFAADVLLEQRGGERIAVDGTPMFFVNGVWLRWESTDVAGIRAAVDAALAKAGVAPPARAAAP
jgi:protein-disulfide isomerase